MFELKIYQETTLAVLKSYLDAARLGDLPRAFAQTATPRPGAKTPDYQPLPGLADIPYVCLRLPTGGGKTFLAAHSIGVAADRYLEQDYPLVLWLVPTNTIREQTLLTLKNPRHPNHEAIAQAFNGQVRAFDITEFEQIRPHDLTSGVCVVVSTMATLRVNNTDGRRVYAHNENLEPHFTRVSADTPGLERIEDGQHAGEIRNSFRNLLALSRPLILVDEAHNLSSDLSFEILDRLQPACVIEFTATPASNSNILHSVTATDLKTQQMIKLPILLTEHTTWQEAIRDSILRRDKLHELARLETDYIRPIVLIQAENKDREVTVEVVEKYLVEQEQIARGRIAIATGAQRELDGVNLLDPQNKVEFVITVEALKEGWDCPFAYVFCSLATVHSKRDVEQLLGRVLRMPYARKRGHEDLNRAYAHVSQASWPQAVNQLCDRLVSMGFEEQEAEEFVRPQLPLIPTTDDLNEPTAGLAAVPLTFHLSLAPDLSQLAILEQAGISVTPAEGGGVVVKVAGDITEELASKLLQTIPVQERAALEKTIAVYKSAQRPLSPAERGETLAVPQLCLRLDTKLEVADHGLFLEASGWDLMAYPPELSPGEFDLRETADTYEIDLHGQRLIARHLEQATLGLNLAPTEWTDLQLSRWFDSRVQKTFNSQTDNYIRQPVLLEFIRRTIAYLMNQRKLPLTALVRFRHVLQKALEAKVRDCYLDAARRGYQSSLFGPTARVETGPEYCFSFDPNGYVPRQAYKGRYQFSSKHFYAKIAEFDSDDEYECAQAIDRNRDVKRWVRNIVSANMFRLPLAHGYFYPDFVTELLDGRILIVEFKGAHLLDGAQEKINIGELWEQKSGGRGLFLVTVAQNADDQHRDVYRQIEDKILGK